MIFSGYKRKYVDELCCAFYFWLRSWKTALDKVVAYIQAIKIILNEHRQATVLLYIDLWYPYS